MAVVGETRNVPRIFVGNLLENVHLTRMRWKGLREIECESWK